MTEEDYINAAVSAWHALKYASWALMGFLVFATVVIVDWWFTRPRN